MPCFYYLSLYLGDILCNLLQFLISYIVFECMRTHRSPADWGHIAHLCTCCSLCLKCSDLGYLHSWLTGFRFLVKCHFFRDAFPDYWPLRQCACTHTREHTDLLTQNWYSLDSFSYIQTYAQLATEATQGCLPADFSYMRNSFFYFWVIIVLGLLVQT